jgi:hypothetical protein
MKKKAKRFIRTCLSRTQDLAYGLQPFSSAFLFYGDVFEIELVPRMFEEEQGPVQFIGETKQELHSRGKQKSSGVWVLETSLLIRTFFRNPASRAK